MEAGVGGQHITQRECHALLGEGDVVAGREQSLNKPPM